MKTSGPATPSDLLDEYVRIRATTERLASLLGAEDQTVQTMPDVSPTKWHRAHVTWFFETFLLSEYATGYRGFDDAYAYIFNSYYEMVGARHPRPERGLLSRPGIDEIARYRAYVDGQMEALLREPGQPGLMELITLGLHHEQQHQELLLMDIKHVLSRNPLHPVYLASTLPGADSHPPKAGWLEHDGGQVEIGHHGDGFAFDNEYPPHNVLLTPFGLADRPVTCGEWLAFMEDDGYRRPEFWLSDGWAVVNAQHWDAPLYWSRDPELPDRWLQFTLSGLRPVDPDEPVCHVSYYEADAFAHWTGMRLPTESEWEVIAVAQGEGDNFLHDDFLQRGAPHPQPAVAQNELYGNTWEWTSSAYSPYPGFRAAPGAVGEYNGKFMVSQYVLRGGCCATPKGHIRATYRNFFPPDTLALRRRSPGPRLLSHVLHHRRSPLSRGGPRANAGGCRSGTARRTEVDTSGVVLRRKGQPVIRGDHATAGVLPHAGGTGSSSDPCGRDCRSREGRHLGRARRGSVRQDAPHPDRSPRRGHACALRTVRRQRRVPPQRCGHAVPGIRVRGDASRDRRLPSSPGRDSTDGRRMVAFLGGTIGNLDPAQRARFLFDLNCTMSSDDCLLLGTDLVKDRSRLVAAYDDAAGVTAEFNRNVLHVLNQQLGGNFDPAQFRHVALWNEEEQWIEMRLRAQAATEVSLADAGITVRFEKGEELLTEISAKFTPERVAAELEQAGFVIEATWGAEDGEFLLTLAHPYC